MDKKVRNRILYIIVGSLWIVAIYRTYKNYRVKQENESTKTLHSPHFSPVQFNKDTFELVLPSKDPFLAVGWMPTQDVNLMQEPKSKTEIKKEEPKPLEKTWPQIEYFGFVKNRDKNSTLCLLKIDGRQIHISKGQKHNGILVLNTYRDSVQVFLDGESRIIRR